MTTRARLNSKHIDERVRIVEEKTGKIPQAVRWWHVSRWGCVWLDTGESFGRVGRAGNLKVSTIVITAILIILVLLHKVIWLDISVEKEGSTYWSNRMRQCWDNFGSSDVPMHEHIWNFRILCKVSRRERTLEIASMIIAYR
jgi:hypothetical protein